MDTFKPKFTRIQEPFSTARRIPRLGRIRNGIKVQKIVNGRPAMKDGRPIEYPKETPHFVVPTEVQRVYGSEPTELDVMLPADDPEIIFPQKLAWYGSGRGLRCQGDGQQAERYNEQTKQWEPRSCPCEQRKTEANPKGECTEQAHLMVLLPRVNVGGVYQVTTRSYNSVVDINSGLDYVRALVGRIAMVPLKLRKEARATHHDCQKQVHYTMTLTLDADIEGINKLREDSTRILSTARFRIEGPVEENPALDPPDAMEIEEAEVVPPITTSDTPVSGTVSSTLVPPPAESGSLFDHADPFEQTWADALAYLSDDPDRNDTLRDIVVKKFAPCKRASEVPLHQRKGLLLTVQDELRRRKIAFQPFVQE